MTVPDTPHHRAMAESGWDNTARFGDDTTMVVPVDLNAQLFRYEQDLAGFCATLGRSGDAAAWRARAAARRALVNRYLWDERDGVYRDLDLRTGQPLASVPRAERYNVADPEGPTPGRYPPQRGFGWTNGVFAALLTRVVLGIQPAGTGHQAPAGGAGIAPPLPASWRGRQIRVSLPRYWWPAGTRQDITVPAAG
ncbi:MAG: trehalase family glycosidase [Gemmatimonadota bacterium]